MNTKQFFYAYGGGLLALIVLDFIWIGLVAASFYQNQIGHLMADSFNFGAAAIFYIGYVAGVIILAVKPALQTNSWKKALGLGALVGLLAYGAYDFTNYASLRDWPLTMLVVDLLWGVFVTGAVSLVGYLVVKK